MLKNAYICKKFKTMNRLKHTYTLIILFFIALCVLVGCHASPTDEKIVTVSIEPQKYLLEQITGDKVQVRCLLSDGANPENYDPSMTHLLNLGKSLAYLRMGNIGFEAALLDKISESNPELPIFNTSEGVLPIKGTHGHDGVSHEVVDPHTWSSVRNARVIARNMVEAMKKVDGENAAFYQKNYERLATHLDSLDAVLTARLAPVRGSAFMVWHPSLSYFARDYGLEQVVVGGHEHKEQSVNELRETIDRAREHGAKVFFYQKEFDSRQVAALNVELDARQVQFNPMSYDWENEIISTANALVQ